MTGGSNEWRLESKYLFDPAHPDAQISVSTEYNQIWEVKGADSEYEQDGYGKLILLDGDGISGDGDNAKRSKEELMTSPQTLKDFINYTVENFPAQKYGLIFWDHGGNVVDGFGFDEHAVDPDTGDNIEYMSLAEIIDALSDNDVIKTNGKFDFVDFDACIMNGVEYNLALSSVTKYYIASVETEPGYGQEYSGWLNALGKNPNIDTFELGKILIADYIKFYEEGEGTKDFGTLAIVNLELLMKTNFLSGLNEMNDILKREVNTKDAHGSFLFYDEITSLENSINYADNLKSLRDAGNFISQLPITIKEISETN